MIKVFICLLHQKQSEPTEVYQTGKKEQGKWEISQQVD